MDIFFPHTFRERAAFKESAVKCGFVELTAETAANVGILPADERISILLMAWKNIGNYLSKNPYSNDVGITVSWVGRCTLNLWFGREWIACAIEDKTELIEQMMKVYPAAFITMHPYSWPYMFSIYRDPWMVEYLNLNFQRMSGPDLTPVLESKDSEFIQQEGIPLLILRMVNMFDFRMVKLVKYMCLRLLLTWQDSNSTASQTLRASPNANQYINYARHIYLLAICESNGFKDLHYTLETIQRVVHCDLKEIWPLELGAQAIAKGLQETNTTLTELLIEFLFKVPKIQFGNMFGSALTKYIYFLTEYQLRNINRLNSVKLSLPIQEVYLKLVEMFITHRESSEELIKTTSKLSEQIFREFHDLTASKCAYELIKQRPRPEWYTSKITLLLTIISEEVNIIQDFKYNDVQSTDELIEKEKEVALYYRDLAKLFHKSPYLEQEAWLTTFSLHPCREFMDAVIKCGGRNLRAIKKQAHKLNVIEAPEPKTKINEDSTIILKEEDVEKQSQKVIEQNVSDITADTIMPSANSSLVDTSETIATNPPSDPTQAEIKSKTKRPPRTKSVKHEPKKIEPKIESKNKYTNILTEDDQTTEDKTSSPFKRGRPVGALGKDTKSRSKPANSMQKTPAKKSGERPDLAEEIFAAAAGAADNINSQTIETIKYPAFALMNSVTDTEELMKFTNYDEAYEQYTELNRILSSIKLNRTCYEDLLTLLIAPRYKRLTWAVSWKKLKKRCRVILTKDNKKRELVEQSMADANDRLTHLNIDYNKYKDKPQIDYGTIEGGYECYDTDSDDDELKTNGGDVKKQNERQSNKKKVDKFVGSSNKNLQIEEDKNNTNVGVKAYLKIENLDSTNSNLLNIIESTHLSKPVYLNKPVYFVRNPLASPLNETAISLECAIENKPSSRTSSRRSTGEETLTSDSFEEHHAHLAQKSPEMTFNIPASIREQLEQPTMFFKSEVKNDSKVIASVSKPEELQFENKITDSSEALNFSPSKGDKPCDPNCTPKQTNSISTVNTSFSPKLFEDMPEDLTMPKSSNTESLETNTPHSNLPLNFNLTNSLVNESVSKSVSFQEESPNSVDDDQSGERPLKKGRKRPLKSITKINPRKRQTKKDKLNLTNEELKDLKPPPENTQLSTNQQSLISTPTSSLKSVRILPNNKNSKAIRINPTAAVVFSSAAASYHRTPFLNVAEQEPNILQQLLSKEIEPFSGIDDFFDKSTALNAESVSTSKEDKTQAFKLDTQGEAIQVSDPLISNATSTLELKNSNTQSSLSAVTLNPKSDIGTFLLDESISCGSGIKKTYVHNTSINLEVDGETYNALRNHDTKKLPTINENLVVEESPATANENCLKAVHRGLAAASDGIKLTSNFLDQSKNIQFCSSDFDFEFKVPAVVPKPCSFLQSKQKKVSHYVSDWVKNITFNDKTAEIIVPVSRNKELGETFDRTKIIGAEDEQYNKCSCSNELGPSVSQNPSDDILYNKHIVFNTKLLDPHLKTYKNTKASGKITDAKKFKPIYLETDEVFSENPEESNAFDKNQFDPTIPNAISEQSTDSTFEKVTSPHDKQLPPLSATALQNIVCPIKKSSESDVQHTSIKANKRRCRNIPSTKKFDKMFEWIDNMVTPSRRSESVDKSETLLNLFSAQLMNQAKSIHFNSEYLREKELLKNRDNEDGINCEASILIASPGPSEDCVKLIKAFKKSTVFKGVDLSSNEVSFTSSLAKEVLGTIIKVTLNESKTHTSCSGNHFDASDALDEFIRSRRCANSPTFYSPTLSMKHLKKGTLADSVECIDTSLEKLIPKPGRKRSTVPAPATVTKRIKNRRSTDCLVSSECKKQSLDEENLSPLKEVERITETNVADTLKIKTQQEIVMASNCSTTEITGSPVSESVKVSKPLVHIHAEQHSFNQFPAVIDDALESNTKESSVNEDVMQSVTNEYNILQKDQSIELSKKDKQIEQSFNSLETLDLKLELSEEKEQKDGSGERVNSKDKEHDIEKKPSIKRLPIKKIKIERNSSVCHRTRRNTYDGTKYILKEETEIISSRTKKTKKISGDNKLDNLGGRTCKYLIEGYTSDEPKHLAEKEAPNTKANELRETEKEADNFQIEDSLEGRHKVYISDEKEVVKLEKNVSLENENLPTEENILLADSKQNLQGRNEPEDLKEETNQQIVEELNNFKIKKEEIECPLSKVLPVEENKHSVPKKRIAKPIISYVELDSDSDEPPKSRLKIPSLKINFPLIRTCRRKLLNRSVAKKNVSSKCSAKRASKTVKKNLKKSKKSFVRSKKNADSSLNDSEDDKPLLSKNNKPESDKVRKFDDSEADNRSTQSHDILNESDDDAPLKKIPNRLSTRKKLPSLLTPMKKKTTSKLPVRKRYRNAYSPKRPSVRIQSKFSRRRTTSLNYFALFLSDSEEEDPVKTKKRSRTPDKLWTNRSVKRKTAIETVKKKASHKRKLRCNRVAIKQQQRRNRLPKTKPPIKMPVLTREDSDHPVEENIYECATMSTANETDEDACSDRRPKRRRQKVVKPMRIRCVSRRAIPTDVITEFSSCSSNATVQTSRDLGKNTTSVTSFTRRGRLLRRKTLEKNLLMSNFCCESSSSSSPVMMNRRRRQFAAKSTSKPPLLKEQTKQTNAKSFEPLSSMEKEAIQIHNCVNFQIRLQRLTANEAILCRKPYIRLDRNFVRNYFVEKNMEYNDESELEEVRDDYK